MGSEWTRLRTFTDRRGSLAAGSILSTTLWLRVHARSGIGVSQRTKGARLPSVVVRKHDGEEPTGKLRVSCASWDAETGLLPRPPRTLTFANEIVVTSLTSARAATRRRREYAYSRLSTSHLGYSCRSA
jgi:hypothetical protein